MAGTTQHRVSIGKFEILATYTFAKALLDGQSEAEAKERGMLAAVMGAKARLGVGPRRGDDSGADEGAAEKKKAPTITAAAFDRQVRHKLGAFFDRVFLPTMKRLVRAGLSYEEVKQAVGIPARWGSKIGGEQFRERAAEALKGSKRR
jgi:hypothetical protein